MKNVVIVMFVGFGLVFYQLFGGVDFELVECVRIVVVVFVVEVMFIDFVFGLLVDGIVIFFIME